MVKELTKVQVDGVIGYVGRDLVICGIFDNGEVFYHHQSDDGELTFSFKAPDGFIELGECSIEVEYEQNGEPHGLAFSGWID